MRDGASTAVPTASTAVAVWLRYVDDKGMAYPAQEHNKNARTDTPTDLLENYNQGQQGDLTLTIPKVWWQFQGGPVESHEQSEATIESLQWFNSSADEPVLFWHRRAEDPTPDG